MKKLFILIVFIGCLALITIYKIPVGNNIVLTIKKTQGLSFVADKIYSQKSIKDNILKASMLAFGKIWIHYNKKMVKIGEYEIKKTDTIYSVINKIVSGEIKYYNAVFPEGLTTEHILHEIKNNNILMGEISVIASEGELFPDTYRINKLEKKNLLIRRMKKKMSNFLEKEWKNRDPDLPFNNPYEALILASIIEKEVGASYCITDEYKNVASIFINRLKKGMRLQSCPTVFYGLPMSNIINGDVNTLRRNPTFAELKNCHPYNTYCIKKLPPTPICNPGAKAINAVLHPAKTDYLFFISDGNNCHKFSKNFEDHRNNRSKNKK